MYTYHFDRSQDGETIAVWGQFEVKEIAALQRTFFSIAFHRFLEIEST